MKSRWNSSTKKKSSKKRLLLRLSFEKKGLPLLSRHAAVVSFIFLISDKGQVASTHVICIWLFDSRTLCCDELVASLVDYTYAYLALIPLLAKAPNEVAAVWAEGGLSQKGRHEFVRIDLMDTTFHCTSTVFFRETTFALLELTDRLRLFLLRCPLQFDFHVQTSVGFQISLKNKITNGKSRSYHLIWSLGM